jgi:WhiB family redox-sensing transcriptional regulator
VKGFIDGTDNGSAHRSAWGLDTDTEVDAWKADALCAQTDPEAFFPEKGGSTREAKRICIGCPVREECLDYALEHDERFGIWGGLSERERRALKRGDRGPEVNITRTNARPCRGCGETITSADTTNYCSTACRSSAYRKDCA